MFKWGFVFLLLLFSGARAVMANETSSRPWSAVILSDIHVYKDGTVERNFLELVNCLVPLRPKFVVITGDSTNGNKSDGVSKEKAALWWRSLKASLMPLTQAGAQLFPVAGNHDYYDPVHQRAYKEAWAEPLKRQSQALEGNPPLHYSFEYEGVHFAFAHVIAQSLQPTVREWLEKDLSHAKNAKARFVFGHVPFSTVLGEKVPKKFMSELGELLASHNVDAYVAGHEHLVWDETFHFSGHFSGQFSGQFSGAAVRQVIIGTASASYNFPISKRVYEKHCTGAQCRMPTTGNPVSLVSEQSRLQSNERTFAMIHADRNGTRLELMTFRPLKPARGDRLAADKVSAFGCEGKIVAFE